MTFNTGTAAAIVEGLTLATVAGQERVCITDSAGHSFFLDPTSGQDAANAEVLQTVATGWMHASGPQGRQSLKAILALLKKQDEHRVTVSLYESYDDTTATRSETWEPDVLDVYVPEEIQLSPDNPQCVALKCQIDIGNPTDTTTFPVTTGRGADLLDMSVYLAPKGGHQKLPADNKA